MEKEKLIKLLKEYKENKAKLNVKLKELKTTRIKLKNCNDTDTSITSSYGINQDIHSKNKISNKVLDKIEEQQQMQQKVLNSREELPRT